MNVSLEWIKSYVKDLDITKEEYTDAMTMSGTKVEGYEALDADIENIVIGEIIAIDSHPDADKLVVCQVHVGSDKKVQIVTGAKNVSVGDKVPVVLDGGKVAGGHDGSKTPGGITIKKGKLRGVASEGMLCSIEELGSSREFYPEAPEDGIYIFGSDAIVGESAIKALGLDDVVFEYEVTSNRVDCFSVIGVARETAATFKKEFNLPEVKETGNDESASDYIDVAIENTDLCNRFCARVVKNVKIGPSPAYMQRRLAALGIRPINNVVDITNYVMEEYGQPMHAYDLETIAGRKIVVKTAKDGDTFTTLDGQDRKVDATVLMICDGEKEIGLAGIMGGENTMITDDATTVLFEAANFDGTNIRKSSKKVGLRTDASGKFEKGLDPNNAKAAVDRACELMEEMQAGDVIGGIVDVYPNKREEVSILFDEDRINSILGTKLSKEVMLEFLAPIGLKYEASTNMVQIPTYRPDVKETADLAEEVARFYGYDNIPTTLPKGEATTGKLSFKLRVEAVAGMVAECYGFSQGMTYSFESPKVFDKLRLPAEDELRNAIEIRNPLGEDFSIMRTISLNGMLTSLATNYKRRNKNVRLYEFGNIYLPTKEEKELPNEKMQLTLGMYGEGDFFSMKGVIEELLYKIGLHEREKYTSDSNKPFLHPGRQANIWYGDVLLGYLGEVHPEVMDTYGIAERTIVAVIDMPEMEKLASFDRKYSGIARYPAITRDISLVSRKETTVGEMEDMIRLKGGEYLEQVSLFDVYDGEQIKAGYKSVAFALSFRAKDRTLEDADVQDAMKQIVEGLSSMGMELRQ